MQFFRKLWRRVRKEESAPEPVWEAPDGFMSVWNFYGGYAPGLNPCCQYEFIRAGWDGPCVMRLCDQPDWYNIGGLYWRPISPPSPGESPTAAAC